ncbi:energy transducer TonB [Arenimonas alkanexedens]
MKRFWLLLLLLLVTSMAMADDKDVQLYTTLVQGDLSIGAEGEVLDVELSSRGSLGKGVLEGFEQRIRAWRFEPILVDGQPVIAKGRMHLSLVATRKKGDSVTQFGIRHVRFLEPAGTASTTSASRLVPPSYPSHALRAGAGAQVLLLVKLDAEGRPSQVTTEQLELLGVATRQAHQGYLASQFRRSAERVAERWSFHGHQAGDVVRVPVTYMAPGMSDGWIPTVVQAVDLPEWAVLELSTQRAVELNADGSATAAQFKLMTALDGA